MASLEERKQAIEARHTEQLAKIAAEEERQKRIAEIDKDLSAMRVARAQLLQDMQPLLEERGGLVRHHRKGAAE
jgi:hypothetical protein